MKCIECNKSLKSKRSGAKYCSHNCQVKNYNRRKKEKEALKKEQEMAFGKVQEQQKKKVLNFDCQIQFISQKIKAFQVDFKILKKQEETTLIELQAVQEIVKENEQKIQRLKTILTLNDKKFYNSYCNDVETKADLGFLLNGIINNYLLIEVNANERNREIKRVKSNINNKLMKLKKVFRESSIFLKEVYQNLMTIRGKLKKKRDVILVGIEKIRCWNNKN